MSEEQINISVKAACPKCFLGYEVELADSDLVGNGNLTIQERVWATCDHCRQFPNMDEDELLARRMQIIDKAIVSGGAHLFKSLYSKIKTLERSIERIWDYIDPED